VLALALIVAVESFAFDRPALWQAVSAAIPEGRRDMYGGTALDELAAARLAADERGGPTVAFLSSSRGQCAWPLEELPADQRPPWQMALMTHPGIRPLHMLLQADRLARLQPDVVVLMLSEFDTHRALALVPHVLGDSPSAVLALASLLDPAVVWEHRQTLARFALASVLPSYRFRRVFGLAGLDRYRSFGRRAGQGQGGGWPEAIPVSQPLSLTRHQLDRVTRAVRDSMPAVDVESDRFRNQLGTMQAITRGPHAQVQMEIVRQTVERLVDAGIDVLLVEGPVAALPAELYDPMARYEYRSLAEQLAAAPSVHLLTSDESGPFALEAFRDLFHLDDEGAARMTAATLAAVEGVLRQRAQAGR
jgi:hypothetical protein